MATLVLSTVGNALGGPVGSAIGALIGQSIDRELLSAPKGGPRIGDLIVRTSSYGTRIPRVYGTMRVAGSVIWSTDLIEHQQSGGAKGQPDVTYNYTVSFAVALSSRTAISVKRIWADGNLLRGAAGDFKVGCTFRFYDGGADQIIDPLIGSVEGIANTPGYRGFALAVFEDLQLATFGNRIPFLTFEVEGDSAQPSLCTVLSDASTGLIDSDVGLPVSGFAAYGASITDALGDLVETYAVSLFDDGRVLRGPSGLTPGDVAEADLGNSADAQSQPRIERQQTPVLAIPTSLRLTYYDPDRDYQSGEARALAGEEGGKEAQRQLPAVLTAADAKSLAQDVLARTFAERDAITLRLPPSYLGLEPGSLLKLPVSPPVWRVDTAKIDGFVIVAEVRPISGTGASISADPGRIVPSPDLQSGPVTLALIDVPNVTGSSMNDPLILVAASSEGAGWNRPNVEVSFSGQSVATRSAPFKSVLGSAASVLGDSASELIDERNAVDVQLIDRDQWLTSCDEDGLAAGMNLAIIGSELIQFGQALPLGDGRFRLSRLLRGRGGTEWAISRHATDDVFCLLNAPSLQPVMLPTWSIGATIAANADVSIKFGGENVRPLSPVDLTAARTMGGDLSVVWTRRSRQGFAWVDGIDAPLAETREQYRLVLSSADKVIEYFADQPSFMVPAADLAGIAPGEITIEAQQIGDFAASRVARLTINLS